MFPFASAGGRPPGFYQIDRSLRFNDDDSAYLSRTPGSAGNRKTWTLDIWCKRGNLGGTQYLWSAGSASTDYTAVFFDTNNKLNVIRVISSSTDAQKVSTAVYRDPSAWYNVTVKMDAANTNLDVYVNGGEITAWDTNNEPSNIDGAECNAVIHEIGRRSYTPASTYFDGYLAYAHFLDGTASAPFTGQTDVDGVWRPKAVGGVAYGTTGWYLSFADNTSTTTLGYDDAGSNDWTLNGFSVSAGVGNDSLEDTPTNNWCVLSSIDGSASAVLTDGGLTVSATSVSTVASRISTLFVSTGKWYWEATQNADTNSNMVIGIVRAGETSSTQFPGQLSSSYGYIARSNLAYNNNSSSSYGSGSASNGDVLMYAFDADNGRLFFGKSGTWYGSGDPVAGTNAAFTGISGTYAPAYAHNAALPQSTGASFNFGQRPFAYTPPSGFEALCTANLPTPVIANPGKHMNAVTYTGTGSSLGVTGVGFQPDLVWIKSRSAATDHALYDSTRGVQNQLESNTTTDETTETTGLTAFGSDGFTVGALAQVNTNAATYVGWCWKEGVTPGFDIVTYTGTGVARTISHNLGTVPKLIIVKARSTASTDQGWPVYHASNTAAPETDYLLLNSTAATADLDTVWNDTAPTTTVFSVGTNALVNALNDTYVAYLFAEVEGFSKIGSYTGNGSADGVFVWTGHRPRFLMLKAASAAGTFWVALDSARIPYNTSVNMIFLNVSNAADTTSGTYLVDFLSNGFKLRGTGFDINGSGVSIVFASFAEQPFSAPSNAR